MRAPAVRLDGACVRAGDVEVLKHVTFTLPAGRFLAVIGPNGAGKSTLVRLLLGLIHPNRGSAEVFGGVPGRAPERIGYVPQLKSFDRSFPATALELVVSGVRRSWPGRATRHETQAATAALGRVGAPHLARRSLARLSGGELQRTFLARALVRGPDLLLLDEPATGVDVLAEHDLYELLEAHQAATGATVLMVTHDLSAARHHASDVLVLNRSVHGFGPPEEALQAHCLERAYGHVGHAHGVALP